MRVNADSLLIRAAATLTSGTLNDLTTDLIMANNNNNLMKSDPVQTLLLNFLEESEKKKYTCFYMEWRMIFKCVI